MALNILITSLSSAESDPSVRYYSFRNEFSSDYCDALQETEASIKAALSRYSIDDVVVIGGENVYHEGEDLKSFPLSHGSALYSADRAALSAYGLLQYRLAQFLDELSPDLEAEAGLIPVKTQEKLIAFIRDYQKSDSELKDRKFNRLFDAFAQDKEIFARFREALLKAFPGAEGQSGDYIRWIKNYLYSELKPTSKMELLPVNDKTCIRLIPEDLMGAGGQWVDRMMAMRENIIQDAEDINLYVSLNSSDAADNFIIMNMLDILVSMPGKYIQLKKILTVRSSSQSLAGIIRDDTQGFGLTELTHALRSFLNYGKADMIASIWEKSGARNESIASMIYAMCHVDAGLSTCNLTEMEQGILRLRQLFQSEKLWREFGYYGILFSVVAESIQEDYGPLMEGSGDIPFFDLLKWAYRHQFYQQTLTLIESRFPDILVNSGIFYYCDDESQEQQIIQQFALRRLDLKPYEYYKMDSIEHYFVKNCDRGAPKGKGARGEDAQRVYAAFRAQSVENTNPSLIKGYTACDSLETLENILYAYYHIGDIRNKVNHADTSVLTDRRLIVSESDESTALVMLKESIDFFIISYEKAMAEVQGKKPNIVSITSDEVRIAADHMKFDKRKTN